LILIEVDVGDVGNHEFLHWFFYWCKIYTYNISYKHKRLWST